MRVREAPIAGALSLFVFAGCASTSGGASCGISCAADGVCQPACVATDDHLAKWKPSVRILEAGKTAKLAR